MPIVCGSEPAQNWPQLRQEMVSEASLFGNVVLTTLDCTMLKHQYTDLDCRIAFSKNIAAISKHHFIICLVKLKIVIKPLEPILINRKLVSEGEYELKQNDQISFPKDDAQVPDVYHVQFIHRDDENYQRSLMLRPLVQGSVPNLQMYINLLRRQSHEEAKATQEQNWTNDQMIELRKYLLSFGYGRWSKIRATSAQSDKILHQKRDSQMRPHANYFLLLLSQCLEDKPHLAECIVRLIRVNDRDIKLQLCAQDFVSSEKTVSYFKQKALVWTQKILAVTELTQLIRQFRSYKIEGDNKNLVLLNFLQSKQLFEIGAQYLPDDQVGSQMTRAKLCQLLVDTYDKGLNSQSKEHLNYILKVLKLVSLSGPEFNFMQKLKEASGFNIEQKNKIFQTLTSFGIPISFTGEEGKEDWALLQNLLDKHLYGNDSLPDQEKVYQLERFVQQMDIVASKIIKDYNEPIKQILAKKASQTSSDSSSSDSSDYSDSEDVKKNDFHIDKKRLKAAFKFENESGQQTRFDPDGDNFDFGYEMALTFKVRVNLLKMIRKEIVAQNFRFWEFLLEQVKEKFGTDKSLAFFKLPLDWTVEVHDKNLLKAVNENGLNYLGKMKDNREYEFGGILTKRKFLLRRLEQICYHYKSSLVKYKKLNERVNGLKGGDKSTGNTRIDLKKKFTKVNIERDLEGNILYPIVISPTLSILNLGVVEWERPAYHSEKNIFPIGFKSLRKGTSMVTLGKQDEYICEVLDGGKKPMFKVTCSSEPTTPIIQQSSSGVWIEICRRVNELQGGQRQKVTVSGPDRYGLSEPGVGQLLSCLPDAEKCVRFKPPQ